MHSRIVLKAPPTALKYGTGAKLNRSLTIFAPVFRLARVLSEIPLFTGNLKYLRKGTARGISNLRGKWAEREDKQYSSER
jgi:hypothetical protein